MTDYPTDVCGPASEAREQSGYVVICVSCHTERQYKAKSDLLGCPFCNAGKLAQNLKSEKPTYGGARLLGQRDGPG